jgi:hypothetical protein
VIPVKRHEKEAFLISDLMRKASTALSGNADIMNGK